MKLTTNVRIQIGILYFASLHLHNTEALLLYCGMIVNQSKAQGYVIWYVHHTSVLVCYLVTFPCPISSPTGEPVQRLWKLAGLKENPVTDTLCAGTFRGYRWLLVSDGGFCFSVQLFFLYLRIRIYVSETLLHDEKCRRETR